MSSTRTLLDPISWLFGSLMVARRDEHGIGLDRHPISIAQMTCRIRFRTVSVLRPSLGAQPTQRRWSHIPNCERAGVGRFARPMCRRAEHMVEDQRADSAMHMAGRPFVSRAKLDL